MIQSNELRIGNLFQDEDNTFCYFAGAWQRVDGWIIRDSGNNTYKPTQAYPIPLSPELLEACGFENIGEPFRRWISNEIGIDITEGEGGEYNARFIKRYHMAGGTMYAERNGPYIEMIFCPQPISFLHQLMNLWHSLTGTELSINIEKVKV